MIFVKILKNTIQLKSRKILIVFDDMIADTLSNKNLNPVVTELFIRGKKLIFFFFFGCCPKKYYTKFNTLFSH